MNPFSGIASELRKRFSKRRRATMDSCVRVSNLTRNTVLATCMEVADSAAKRNKGLLGRKRLAPGEGLWIRPCQAVHTFFMRFSIDLIYLDRRNRIRKLSSEVRPWRLSACLWARSVLELPAGTIRQTQTQRGDALEFSAASLTSGCGAAPEA
jgi:uncharacterized membrane protein (UPF0127 family)